MPSGSYRQVDVKCPFYKYDDGKRRIICEGAFDDGDSLANVFRKGTDYERQMGLFCCGDYTKCGLYQMLAARYNE